MSLVITKAFIFDIEGKSDDKEDLDYEYYLEEENNFFLERKKE